MPVTIIKSTNIPAAKLLCPPARNTDAINIIVGNTRLSKGQLFMPVLKMRQESAIIFPSAVKPHKRPFKIKI